MLIQFVIIQVIVFAIAIVLLKRILTSDAKTAENRLNQVYEELVEKQRQLTKKIEEAEKDYQDKKEEANNIVKKMKKDAQTELQAKEDSVIKEAKAQADEMIQKARASADELKHRIEKEVGTKMLDFVSTLMDIAVSPDLAKVMHVQMIQEFIKKGDQLDFSNVSADINVMSIRTAMPLKEEEQAGLLDLVKNKLGREITCEVKEDKSVLAGVILEFGTLLLDGSFSSAIHDAAAQRKKEMEEEG